MSQKQRKFYTCHEIVVNTIKRSELHLIGSDDLKLRIWDVFSYSTYSKKKLFKRKKSSNTKNYTQLVDRMRLDGHLKIKQANGISEESEQIHHLESQIVEYKSLLEKKDEGYDSLQSRFDQLWQEKDLMSKNSVPLEEYNMKVRELTDQIKRKELPVRRKEPKSDSRNVFLSEYESMKSENERLKNDLTRLKIKNTQLLKGVNSSGDDGQKNMGKAKENRLKIAEEEVERLSNEVVKKSDEIIKLERMNEKYSTELATSSILIKQMEIERDEKQSEGKNKGRMKQEKAGLNKKLEESVKRNEEYRDQIRMLRESLRIEKVQTKTRKSRIDDLKNVMKEKNERIEDLNEDIEQERKTILGLQKRIRDLEIDQKIMTTNGKQLVKIRKEQRKAEETIRVLSVEKSRLETQLEHGDEEIVKQKKKFEEKIKEIKRSQVKEIRVQEVRTNDLVENIRVMIATQLSNNQVELLKVTQEKAQMKIEHEIEKKTLERKFRQEKELEIQQLKKMNDKNIAKLQEEQENKNTKYELAIDEEKEYVKNLTQDFQDHMKKKDEMNEKTTQLLKSVQDEKAELAKMFGKVKDQCRSQKEKLFEQGKSLKEEKKKLEEQTRKLDDQIQARSLDNQRSHNRLAKERDLMNNKHAKKLAEKDRVIKELKKNISEIGVQMNRIQEQFKIIRNELKEEKSRNTSLTERNTELSKENSDMLADYSNKTIPSEYDKSMVRLFGELQRLFDEYGGLKETPYVGPILKCLSTTTNPPVNQGGEFDVGTNYTFFINLTHENHEERADLLKTGYEYEINKLGYSVTVGGTPLPKKDIKIGDRRVEFSVTFPREGAYKIETKIGESFVVPIILKATKSRIDPSKSGIILSRKLGTDLATSRIFRENGKIDKGDGNGKLVQVRSGGSIYKGDPLYVGVVLKNEKGEFIKKNVEISINHGGGLLTEYRYRYRPHEWNENMKQFQIQKGLALPVSGLYNIHIVGTKIVCQVNVVDPKRVIVRLEGELANAKNFPDVLKQNLGHRGVLCDIYEPGTRLPQGVQPDLQLYLKGGSMTPLTDDDGIRENMENLINCSTTKSAIYIHLKPKMSANEYWKSFGKIRNQKKNADFPSLLFKGSFIPKEEPDDVFMPIDNGFVVDNMDCYQDQMKQLVALVGKVFAVVIGKKN